MAVENQYTDMSDEPDRQDLEDRVDQLESTIEKMLPSRRDALKLGGAALVGGAAMSGSASAGTQQAGTIGTANDPVDVESEDIKNADTVTTDSLSSTNINNADTVTTNTLDAVSVNPQQITDDRYYAGGFDGSSPSARFDNALSAASIGDVIYLENATYRDPHTIDIRGLTLVGTAARDRGTIIRGNITVSSESVEFIDIRWGEGVHQLNGDSNSIRRGGISTIADITIDGVLSIVEGVVGGSVTLGPNSIQCVVDSCAAFSVTDNGTNNVVGSNS